MVRCNRDRVVSVPHINAPVINLQVLLPSHALPMTGVFRSEGFVGWRSDRSISCLGADEPLRTYS